MSYFDDVKEFHEALEVPIGKVPVQALSEEREYLRVRLMAEEFEELLRAIADEDLVEIADGCADMVVVVLGTAAEFGIPFDRVWAEVHRSNMAKLGGPRREDGKVLKPPDWTPPDIRGAIYPLLKEG